MIESFLGLIWEEAEPELKGLDKPYKCLVTRPQGKMEVGGNRRVVRVRETDDHIEVVLAYEKFSPRQPESRFEVRS